MKFKIVAVSSFWDASYLHADSFSRYVICHARQRYSSHSDFCTQLAVVHNNRLFEHSYEDWSHLYTATWYIVL